MALIHYLASTEHTDRESRVLSNYSTTFLDLTVNGTINHYLKTGIGTGFIFDLGINSCYFMVMPRSVEDKIIYLNKTEKQNYQTFNLLNFKCISYSDYQESQT